MNIYDFGILDNKIDKISEYKNNLLNKIIYVILPFIRKDINSKIIDIKKNKKEIKKIRSEILELRTNLVEINNTLSRKKKINILLSRIYNILSVGSFSDLRPKFFSIVENIDNLSDQEIDSYLSEMIKIISEKFSQSNSSF